MKYPPIDIPEMMGWDRAHFSSHPTKEETKGQTGSEKASKLFRVTQRIDNR